MNMFCSISHLMLCTIGPRGRAEDPDRYLQPARAAGPRTQTGTSSPHPFDHRMRHYFARTASGTAELLVASLTGSLNAR
jgi:hypothetical protein